MQDAFRGDARALSPHPLLLYMQKRCPDRRPLVVARDRRAAPPLHQLERGLRPLVLSTPCPPLSHLDETDCDEHAAAGTIARAAAVAIEVAVAVVIVIASGVAAPAPLPLPQPPLRLLRPKWSSTFPVTRRTEDGSWLLASSLEAAEVVVAAEAVVVVVQATKIVMRPAPPFLPGANGAGCCDRLQLWQRRTHVSLLS
jgi:hypothetical protein